ncbi:MAG: sn-glycerol-1-phosphate dehydrogenase [Caldicoprobacterales bacterium]|nr:sn-glycerol-1-phosphate dehydrogenase [Clostridiales bacterium]
MVNLKEQSIEKLTKLDFKCTCGYRHTVSIDNIRIGSGVLQELPEILGQYKGKKLLVVADKNTFKVAGQQVIDLLSNEFVFNIFIYQDDHLVADANSLGTFLMELDDDISLILTIGSGTLNDITRYVSARTKIPYAIVTTAPSMDGYTSIVSPLIRNGIKTTFNGVYPVAIVGDTQIMKDAPMHMLHAGLGDVLGKYTGLADWRMSKIMGLEADEPYCDNISNLVEDAVKKCVDAAPKLSSRDEDTIQAIMEGLILSGLCIGLADHSRPASGSEHQISHYIEMIFLQENISSKWLHGNKVGVATLATLHAYDYLFNKDIKEIRKSASYKEFDKDRWIKRIERCFGQMADEIFQLKEKDLLLEVEEREKRMDLIESKWEEIKERCYVNLPSADQLMELLKDVGAIYSPKELGVDRELFRDSLIVAKEIRKRYGIMQLLDDLGMLEEAVDYIVDKYY